jgi:DNA-binding winged helix-turn-helix (wHTH) protein
MTVIKNPQKKSKEIPKTSVLLPAPHRSAKDVYYFGSFSLNLAEKQLRRRGEPIRLAPKAFDVLSVLIQNQGCLVTKDQLLAEVWPHVFVEEANLSVNIASLRKVLEEGDEQYIETVPKRGYRFVAPVSGQEETTSESQPVEMRNNGEPKESLNSLAVLPFENEDCGPAGEYLAVGLMESITNNLSQSRELRVMARHTVYSHYACNVDPRTVGQKLGVRSVMAGRILQLDDWLIVRAELIDVKNGWQLWGEQYHTKVSDVLMVQQELTTEIADRLRLRLKILRVNALAAKLAQRCTKYSQEAQAGSRETATSYRLRDLQNLIHLRSQSRQ